MVITMARSDGRPGLAYTGPMPKETIHVTIDPELLRRIDLDREAKGQPRSEWLARAARLALYELRPIDGSGRLAPPEVSEATPLHETPSRVPGQSVARIPPPPKRAPITTFDPDAPES